MINTSRLCGIDGTNGASVSKVMTRGRKENLQLLDIMRSKIPGFENARLKAMGTTLGIRETRRYTKISSGRSRAKRWQPEGGVNLG